MSDTQTIHGPVLVAGGAGYIGSHTVRALQQKGVEVVVVDNLSTGFMEATRRNDVRLENIDIGDGDALDRLFADVRPDAVIHFAAKCYVGESVEQPAIYYRENVFHTFTLLEAMRRAECRRIVFSSTCATYGDPVQMPMGDDHPQKPISPYGKTKLHMEHMMQDYHRAYGLDYAALRYFNAAGASPAGDLGECHDPETHLIPLVLQVAQGKRDEILIFGDDWPTPDGTCVRDYIHVDDLADAHLRALGHLQAGRGPISCNLGTGAGYSVLQVVELARSVTGHPIPARAVARRAGDPAELTSGGRLAKEVLGWEPRRAQLELILADAWRFQSKHPDGYPTS